MAIKVGGQPNLRRMFQRRSRLTVSNALVRSTKAMLFMTFFLQLPCNKYHVNCAASTPEPATEIQARQDQLRAREDR